MTNQLFEDFQPISSKEWKNKIQFELKGADYNDTLIWESLEGIKVRPFYHHDEDHKPLDIPTKASEFQIVQHIYVYDILASNKKATTVLSKGAEVIYFTMDNIALDACLLLQDLPLENTYFFILQFLDKAYVEKLASYAKTKGYSVHILLDPINKLASNGNWFVDMNQDMSLLKEVISKFDNVNLHICANVYQNAGANMVQQIAYAVGHLNEYIHHGVLSKQPIFIEISVGSNYFFEIAKLRALKLVVQTLLDNTPELKDTAIHLIALPSKRNKTLYDYNVNMLRTTTECMSAILGGADYIANLPYDVLYHKENEFGERISRNQLLILKEESYFNVVDNPAQGSYYIEHLTAQLAQKALELFKLIEQNDGLITGLITGAVQKKITQSVNKEQELFDQGEIVLLGSNKYPNSLDHMSEELQLYPFVKQNPRKTLIAPIIERRLAQQYEQERLEQEKTNKQ